jgi:hypothetical protein
MLFLIGQKTGYGSNVGAPFFLSIQHLEAIRTAAFAGKVWPDNANK